jgi:hypothetical protein
VFVEQRTRKVRFTVKLIFSGIALVARAMRSPFCAETGQDEISILEQ